MSVRIISVAVLALFIAAGSAAGQQKLFSSLGCPSCAPCDPCQDSGTGKTACGGKASKSPGLGTVFKTCRGTGQACEKRVETTGYMANEYHCECHTVCLPHFSAGLGEDSGCGTCGPGAPVKGGACGGCGGCDSCGPVQGGGCGDAKGGGCQKNLGIGGILGDLMNCWTCKPRVKKHLYVRQVSVCETPVTRCYSVGKGGKGEVGVNENYEMDLGEPAAPLEPMPPLELEGEEFDFEAVPDVPEPPPLNLGRSLRGRRPPARQVRQGILDALLR